MKKTKQVIGVSKQFLSDWLTTQIKSALSIYFVLTAKDINEDELEDLTGVFVERCKEL